MPEIIAKPVEAIDAPIYVQAFKIPEKVETIPLFTKRLGTTVISIRLMPCMQATIAAISSMDTITDAK